MRSKAKTIKKGLKIVACCILAVIITLVVWQLNEYRKLQAVLLPEDAKYLVPANLPTMAQDIIIQNRAYYLTRPTAQQIDEWAAKVSVQGLTGDEDEELAKVALDSFQAQARQPERITFTEAEEELDFLLRYMRYSFALYHYRGGDDVFIPLFNDIKQEIRLSGAENQILSADYIDILRRYILPAVNDLHTYIGSMNYNDVFPERLYHSYANDAHAFEMSGDKFYGDLNGQRYWLQSVNGEAPEDYLKPGILADGTIAWTAWLYTNMENSDDISCIFQLQNDEGEVLEHTIVLDKVQKFTPPFDDTLYSLSETDDYFYLRNSSLMSIQRNMDLLNQMVDEAPNVRGEKPVIMDLRAHGGGNDYYAMFWLLNYMDISKAQGLNIPMPVVSYDMKTQTIETLWKGKLTSSVKSPGLVSRFKDSGNPLHIRNDTPIFVITDRGCGSSGEWFVSYLARLDNVVIVGENTIGMTIGGNMCTAILPYSRYKATFSTSVSVSSDIRDLEGFGLIPDLYAPPGEAVERVIAMLQRYNLQA